MNYFAKKIKKILGYDNLLKILLEIKEENKLLRQDNMQIKSLIEDNMQIKQQLTLIMQAHSLQFSNIESRINKFNEFIIQKRSNNELLKLHIGCGTLYKKGWVNIDNNSDNNIDLIDLNWDLVKRIPINDNSVDFIYNEHFIEHLSYEEGLTFLKNAFAILKPGGVLRIACPNLDKTITGYINENWREQDWVTRYNYQHIRSSCEMVNLCLNYYPWGHRYVYNESEMINSLIIAGFKKESIVIVKFGESAFSELRNIDTRLDSMIFDVVK